MTPDHGITVIDHLGHCADWKPDCVMLLQGHPDYAGGSASAALPGISATPTTATSRAWTARPGGTGLLQGCVRCAATSIAVGGATSIEFDKFSQTRGDFESASHYAFGVAENSYGWSMRLSQKFASGAERSSDLTAKSWPHMPRRHNQAVTRETVLERASEIAVGNNSSQAG